jgi:DNA-binding PadR family transcriptional regulator
LDHGYRGGLPKSFLQPCLLLLLREEPGYGYDLVTRLKELGIDEDSASVYRALRALEDEGAVVSYWNTSSTGPARRMYRLTPKGDHILEEAVPAFHDTHRAIERYLCRYASIGARRETGSADRHRTTGLPATECRDGGNGGRTASQPWGIFPARPGELAAYARSNHVPDSVVERLEALPDRLYETVTEVLADLGEPAAGGFNGGRGDVKPSGRDRSPSDVE